MAVRQKDIAEMVGLDRSMVAHALRGDPRISEITRQRVLQAAAALGYTESTNGSARLLASKRYHKRVDTGIIAVLLTGRCHGFPLRAVPFFMPILDGIEIEAGDRDLDVYLAYWHEDRLPRLVSEGGVDGLICPPTLFPIDRLKHLNLPIVQLVEVGNQRPAISPDNVLGARLAVEHLLNLGHRRIAFLAMKPGSPALRQRMQGYREALTAAGIAMRPELVEELIDPCEEAGAEGMTRLLARENFTGLVCYNDLVAMGAMDVARAAGIRVPEDLSVVGFDDVSEAYHYEVPLTTLRFDRMHMGRRAVELVYEIRSGLVDESGFDAFTADEIVPGSEILPVELVVRGSTGPAPLN